MNQITHFLGISIFSNLWIQIRPTNQDNSTFSVLLDGSTVYGSDEEDERELRQYSGGLLKVNIKIKINFSQNAPRKYVSLSGNGNSEPETKFYILYFQSHDPSHGKGLLPQDEEDEGENECQIPKNIQNRENKKCFKAKHSTKEFHPI